MQPLLKAGGRRGANTRGTTLEEARANLEKAVRMVLKANRALTQEELHGASVIRETRGSGPETI